MKAPGPVGRLAAEQQGRARGSSPRRAASSTVSRWSKLDSGPMSVAGIERIAGLHRLHARGEPLHERVVDVGVDDHPLGADAGLAGVLDARLDRLLRRRVEIGGRHDDERVRAAKLEHHLLERLAGRLGDRPPGALAAGEGDGGDAVVGDQRRDRGGLDRADSGTGPRARRRRSPSSRAARRTPWTMLACFSRPTLPAMIVGARKRTACQ